jgi:uncharacterized protein
MRIPRQAEATVRKLAEGYPVVAVTGPRQSGKTTLVRGMFEDRPFVSLEDLDERQLATDDPRAFLARYPDGAVLDEVQRAPELFSYLQTIVDRDGRTGLFVLTGSQQFDLLSGITQSLAGRAALVRLLPFTLDELQEEKVAPESLEDLLFQGLYPPIHDRRLDPTIWYGNYVRTYVERDVRQMINVRDLSAFQRFVRMCAGRCGQLLNLTSLGNDCGITHNTAKAWLSVLEASYIVHLLRPHHRSFDKRLVKSPKLYFHDPGLAAWLLGIRSPEQLATHPLRGPLFEGWVVSELLKGLYNSALEENLYHWRDQAGLEVDVLIDRGTELVPVEAKSGQTVNHDFFTALGRWRSIAGEAAAERGWLVYGGDRSESRSEVEVVPWRRIGELSAVAAGRDS